MSLKGKGGSVDTAKDGNRLLDSLPPRPRKAVLAQCEPVELAFGSVLCEAGKPFKYAYFPITGDISLVDVFGDHEPFETESIGSEGMLGASLILNINRAFQRGIVQTQCQALRIKTKGMRAVLQSHPALGRVMERYLYVVLAELSQNAGCIQFHNVGKRLARGLLLAHDRAQTDDLPLTHQLLADMLGVQRGAVTIAAIKLQREGIIRYRRGRISILDRKRLEASACECYRVSCEHYASMLKIH